MKPRYYALIDVLLLVALLVIGLLCGCARPVPVSLPPAVCWGLESWHVDGDSVILLKFRKMPKATRP